jgi:hypothetical protein
MSFAKAVASAVLAFAIGGAVMSPADAAKLHKSRTHPHVTTGLSSSTSSHAGVTGTATGGAAKGTTAGSAGGTAAGGAAAEGGGGGMGGSNGM